MNARKPRTTPNTSPRTVRRHRQRVAESQRKLRRAMAELLLEQPFTTITVQQLLQRADIGRATFYAHFQDKHDLLLASFCGMLEAMSEALGAEPAAAARVLPVREFFAHVAQASALTESLRESGHLPAMMELATAHFTRTAEQAGAEPFTARFLAGGMIALLQAWLIMPASRPDAASMDARFHTLARRVLAGRRRSS